MGVTLRIGIDLGGTKIEAAAIDPEGRIQLRRRIATPTGDYDGTIAALAGLVAAIESAIGAKASVGVGMPGTIVAETGLVKNSNSTWLNHRPLGRDVELLILNRFGTAEGGSLRSAFVRAMEAGVPVLTAVRPPYIEAWSKFHGRLAVDLATDPDAVLAWCRVSVRESRAARRSEMSPTG